MGMSLLGLAVLSALCAGLTSADDLQGFVPGYKIKVLYKPEVCDYKSEDGDEIFQQYNGTFTNGTLFDSSYKRGKPYVFFLGIGRVIKGMDIGMRGMCKGERRRITIPPELGYGFKRVWNIPAGSTLIFDVELEDVKPSGFKIEYLHVPEHCPRRSAVGDYIREHYNGTLLDGTIFDTSYQRGRTYDFTLGEGRVIRGVDIGLMDMCEGEIRRLTLPPILAYGSRRVGRLIPPNSTLIFDAELVEIVAGKLRWHKLSGPSCGDDEEVAKGDKITIFYSGFTNEQLKTYSGPTDFYTFTVGADLSVLKGLRKGVIGMCRGERRRLLIPPEEAIGDVNGAGAPQNKRIAMDVIVIDHTKAEA